MSRNFRGEDEGKRVVDHEGNEVGTIELAGDNAEYADVERGGSITEGLMEMLGWESDDDSRLHREHVKEMKGDEVHLKEPQERHG
ncbi:hypothetical protein [Haloprofundus halobius]|uniref:hypothetical protein n=1 Tax=Haloprofundus halobius TaxID=2876194 RepID=UPI001CCCC10C|nr:hypothetical protein [Haloprofundus halobius]